MRVVALISGGKDSCYNMMQCVAAGHTIVALANLRPQQKDELDSYMYQTVGHHGIELYAEAMSLPLYRADIVGSAVDKGRTYTPSDNDEVEDLYRLLLRVKEELDVEAVSVGAILSDYQRIRVENVCQRLGLTALAYLWRRNQKELLEEMITCGVEAIVIKVAALGLDPRAHLGLPLRALQPHLLRMRDKYGLSVCGEGGEYETFTLDCPLFSRRLVVDEQELVIHSDDPVAPVGYLNLRLHSEAKDAAAAPPPPPVRGSLDFVGELNDTVFSDLSDNELSESEREIERSELTELKPLLARGGDKVEDEESIDKPDAGFVYTPAPGDSDPEPTVDHSCIHGTSRGWHFVGGVVGRGADAGPATADACAKLITLLASEGLTLRDVCSVNVYMRDMEAYAQLNSVYMDHFNFDNPPTRVCVQCPLSPDVGLILDAVAYRAPPRAEGGESEPPRERTTIHVQSVSHWAPANIGPYSQAVKVGEVILTCGQIALVPGSMRLAAGGARAQSSLALRHLTRVVRAAHPRVNIRSVVQSVCYVSDAASAAAARRQLERRTAGALAQCAVVGRLPRAAATEWHAWAHTDNNRFEYEETGCGVGDYKVAITRRWNYENTVAAFVCYVATGSSPSACQLSFPTEESCSRHRALAAAASARELSEMLVYALRKLYQDARGAGAVNVRVFYQVGYGLARRLAEAAAAARAEFPRAALTAVPVHALHNAFTFLSISGLRIDE